MAVSIVEYEVKLKTLLKEFLTPSYQIRNDVYLSSLLSHFSGKNDKVLGQSLVNLPFLTNWVIEAITLWETTLPPTPCIGSFCLQITALLSRDECKFMQFKSHDIYNRLFNLLNIHNEDVPPTIKLGYIITLSAFLNHSSGIAYLTSTDHWKLTLKFCLTNQTVYITREGYNFMFNLIEKTLDDMVFCEVVCKEVVAPLKGIHIEVDAAFPEINEEKLAKRITPTLNLLGHIFDCCFNSEMYKIRDFRFLEAFIKDSNLETAIKNIIQIVSYNLELLLELNKILLVCIFGELAFSSKSDVFDKESMRKAGGKLILIISELLEKKYFETEVKLLYQFNVLWQHLRDRAPIFIDNDEDSTFENQLIVLQVLPIVSVSIKHCELDIISLEGDDIREYFLVKVTKLLCEKAIRLAYNWRDIFFDQEEVFKTAHIALTYAIKTTHYFRRNASVIVFQTLMYALQDIASGVKTSHKAQDTFSKQSTYMITLVDGVSTLISNHQITWRDCIETICVMTNAIDLLGCPIWPHRLIVSLLKLVNLSITKFMSPNLALLVDQGSNNMDALGPLLYMKLHDRVWEVRDTALEIVQSLCSISQTKFLSLQKVILDSELPSLVITMAVSDSESYVRASAIKCLAEMVQVNEFWDPVLDKQELVSKILKVLKEEDEAPVRCEAASFISKLYEHHRIKKTELDIVYETMCQTVVNDLYWEVKINALKFWEQVICNHLQNQGMIDGCFPNVTFSKEHRKIVTLTDTEIQNIINKVLAQLSANKCLTAIYNALHDDCDLEVTKCAVKIAKIISDLLVKYNIKQVQNNVVLSPQVSVSLQSSGFNSPNVQTQIDFSDEILDQIINAKDINLLSDVYVPDSDSGICPNECRPVQVISPDTFVKVIQQDFNTLLNEKQKWLNGIDDLGSLLDDMLKSYEDDVNSMDCY